MESYETQHIGLVTALPLLRVSLPCSCRSYVDKAIVILYVCSVVPSLIQPVTGEVWRNGVGCVRWILSEVREGERRRREGD